MTDKKVEKEMKNFLKRNMVFKRVKTFEECTALLIFPRCNFRRATIMLKDDENKDMKDLKTNDEIVVVYLKHHNPRDKRNATIGFINSAKPLKRTWIKSTH